MSNLIATTIKVEKRSELDLKCSKAMHGTGNPFPFFDYPLWYDFFSALSPGWKLLSLEKLSVTLLDSVYSQPMTDTFEKLRAESVVRWVWMGPRTTLESRSPTSQYTPRFRSLSSISERISNVNLLCVWLPRSRTWLDFSTKNLTNRAVTLY